MQLARSSFVAAALLALGCSTNGATTAGSADAGGGAAPAASNDGKERKGGKDSERKAEAEPSLSEVMLQVGRRFEVAGRAGLAHRWELAEYEANEIGEAFEDDVPKAGLPKEGPTAHIASMAEQFRKKNVPELKKAARSKNIVAFETAFEHTASACNRCHEASAKTFIEVPLVPGRDVPLLEAAGPDVAMQLDVRALPLPGAPRPASVDYLAFEPNTHGGRVWVPVGGNGTVQVFDVEHGTFHAIEGWKTATRGEKEETHVVGPSSVAIGNGFAYVGNRAVNEVCAVDLKTLARGPCYATTSDVDGVAALPSLHQVWVTTPEDKSIVVLDEAAGGTLKLAGAVKLPGDPEGYAFDEAHGLFFTNLEDKAKTVSIDVKTRAIKSIWVNGCGKIGPRGVAVDGARGLVMVACPGHVEVLDAAHDGAVLDKVEAGGGVDNIDYDAAAQRLYVASSKAARLTVVHVGAKGELSVVAHADTRDGARNAVADGAGNAYAASSKWAEFVIASPPKPKDAGSAGGGGDAAAKKAGSSAGRDLGF